MATVLTNGLRLWTSYEEAPPSECAVDDIPEPCVLISRARDLQHRPPAAAPLLRLWAEATSLVVLWGPKAVPAAAWADLSDATAAAAGRMTAGEATELLRLLATALHRAGPALNPSAAALAATAAGARAAFRSREHTSSELLEFQAAVAGALRVVVALGSAERAAWGRSMSTKLLPLVSVGMSGVYGAYRSAARELRGAGGGAAAAGLVQKAMFFAEALAPIAFCPASVSRVLETAAPAPGPVRRLLSKGGGAPNPGAPSLSSYATLLEKIHCRAVLVAEWLEGCLAPSALPAMSLHQLDRFSAALAAAGEAPPGKGAAAAATVCDILVCAAGDALEEGARRVRRAAAARAPLSVRSARRMAATARRNWETAASAGSPKAADVASFAAVLEEYVEAKEDEEVAAVRAEIAAAAAQLRG